VNAADVAIATIKTEHHSLSAVLHTMQELLDRVAADHAPPEFALLATGLYYIGDFQERCHHPKEDQYIFKALSAATWQFDPLISELQAAHGGGVHALAQLHRYLVHYQGGAPRGLEMFRTALNTYAMQMANHMRCEEDLLERSREVISQAEWARIAAAFAENDDPLFGNQRRDEFGRLFHRIALLAPRKLKQGLHAAASLV
jgi:hemerythrin-like domain-containing protein